MADRGTSAATKAAKVLADGQRNLMGSLLPKYAKSSAIVGPPLWQSAM